MKATNPFAKAGLPRLAGPLADRPGLPATASLWGVTWAWVRRAAKRLPRRYYRAAAAAWVAYQLNEPETNLSVRYINLVADLHHRDAWPLMNAKSLLTLYLDQNGGNLPQEELLRLADAELIKAVQQYKQLQDKHQRGPQKK